MQNGGAKHFSFLIQPPTLWLNSLRKFFGSSNHLLRFYLNDINICPLGIGLILSTYLTRTMKFETDCGKMLPQWIVLYFCSSFLGQNVREISLWIHTSYFPCPWLHITWQMAECGLMFFSNLSVGWNRSQVIIFTFFLDQRNSLQTHDPILKQWDIFWKKYPGSF